MMSVTLRIEDQITPSLNRLLQELNGLLETVLVRTGRAVEQQAKRTARGKGGENFWYEVAERTHLRVNGSMVRVDCDHVAAAQKQYGGTIRAKNVTFLTIPVSEEARGKRAAEFELGGRDLFVLRTGDSALLGYDEGPSDDPTFVPLYVLKSEVYQRPEPFFPTRQWAQEVLEVQATAAVRAAAKGGRV